VWPRHLATANLRTVVVKLRNPFPFLSLKCRYSAHYESARIEKVFTHEEIAQMIGSSRETVTRLLTILRRRNVIQITTDSVVIRDRGALENMLESKDEIESVLRDISRKV
jgi:CRP-like cAMP-binding protein